VGAITINAAGAKDVVDDKCVGCKLCTIACPYGTMFYDTSTRKAFKCNLCGGDPACAQRCPTRPSSTRIRRRRTGSATSRASASATCCAGRSALMPVRHLIIGAAPRA
jgi:Fe-S-cluster-containing dehydrogenase component